MRWPWRRVPMKQAFGMTKTEAEVLVKMVQTHSLGVVLEVLANITDQKARAIVASYGDSHLASRWQAVSDKLDTIASNAGDL